MSVKLKDINGVMMEKQTIPHGVSNIVKECVEIAAVNKAITQQGNRSIAIDREMLAKILSQYTDMQYPLADAIIANESKIIKYCPVDKKG
jgi:hypothetical protein